MLLSLQKLSPSSFERTWLCIFLTLLSRKLEVVSLHIIVDHTPTFFLFKFSLPIHSFTCSFFYFHFKSYVLSFPDCFFLTFFFHSFILSVNFSSLSGLYLYSLFFILCIYFFFIIFIIHSLVPSLTSDSLFFSLSIHFLVSFCLSLFNSILSFILFYFF